MAPVWDRSIGRLLTHLSTLEGGEGRLPKAGRSKHRREREGGYIMQNTGCWWKRIACHSSLLVEERGHSLAFDV